MRSHGVHERPAHAHRHPLGLRGTPTVVWFVVGASASCAVSIPAVAG
jgi:hypothetical protein